MSIRSQQGMSLAELLVAMIIISVALAGVVTLFSTVVKDSADPLIRKQMLAVAEEMLEEIALRPYAIAGTPPANAATSCGTAGADRSDFDDVADYHNYRTTGICDIDGAAIVPLAGYSLAVTIATGNDMDGNAVGAGNARRITVQVSRGSDSLQLIGWRINYAAESP